MAASRLAPRRPLDPQRVAQHECALWVAYYRREWVRFVRIAVFRHPPRLRTAVAVNDPRLMVSAARDSAVGSVPRQRSRRGATRDGAVLPSTQATHGEPFDPAEAARLEVEWWRVHRVHQHSNAVSDGRALVDALAALYAYAFGVPETVVRIAAEQRALAMRYCDQWVRGGLRSRELADRTETRRARAFVRVIGRSRPTGMTAG